MHIRSIPLNNKSLVMFIFCFLSLPVYSVDACPDPISLIQPDGYSFIAFKKGDEWQNWIELEKGYSIALNKQSGYWEFVAKYSKQIPMLSGIKVHENYQRTIHLSKHIRPKKRINNKSSNNQKNSWITPYPIPTTGNRNLLVIMVGFADRELQTTADDWNTRIFDNSPEAKSVVNYYNDNSFGLLNITPLTHTQPNMPAGIMNITLATNHLNSGENYDYEGEMAWIQQVYDEIGPFLDIEALDTNDNNYLESSEVNIYFIVAGYEASGTD